MTFKCLFYTLILSFSLSANAIRPNCSSIACQIKSIDDGYPSVYLENTGAEVLVCFLFVDERKKVFKIDIGGRSKEYKSQYKNKYQYFSWRCDETKYCPSWARKRHC